MAVESVLRSDHASFELVVIDQSTDPASGGYLASITDERLRVVETNTVGLSIARNLGVEAATTELILMTDDDCVVSTTWISDMCAVLNDDAKVAAMFGVVEAAECDKSKGFVPDGPIERARTFVKPSEYDCRWGIGACLGLRRSAVLEVGGFDPKLGAGARFKSAEEVDVVLRLLLAGHRVKHATSPTVVHHGFRSFEEAQGLVRGYMLGTAAAHAKLFRLGHWSVAGSCLRGLWGSFIPPTMSALRAREIPPLLGRFTWTVRGMWSGFLTPADREHKVFRNTDTDTDARDR